MGGWCGASTILMKRVCYPYIDGSGAAGDERVAGDAGESSDDEAEGSVAAILEGYERGMEEGGRPFVLEESHEWLRAIAESKLRDPVVFWQKNGSSSDGERRNTRRARARRLSICCRAGHPVPAGPASGGTGKLGSAAASGNRGLERAGEWRGRRRPCCDRPCNG